MSNNVSICAIIAVRNEYHYLKILIPYLAEQDIDIVIIDNDSSDQSYLLYNSYRNDPVISVERQPYKGSFSLTEQLNIKQDIVKRLNHDWIIHHDADEIIEHREVNHTLREAIEEADDNDVSIINLDEFVFLPNSEFDYTDGNYYREFLTYYFFQPTVNRLNRIWKRQAGLDARSSGGHRFPGDNLDIFPLNHILRHYITLDQQHLYQKYQNRTFDVKDTEKGWHGNRRNFNSRNLILPQSGSNLKRLKRFDSKDFERDTPCKTHFWDWEDS